MTLIFETLPVVSPNNLRRRSRPEPLDRRAFVGRAAATVGALAIAYITLWDTKRVHALSSAKYFKEYTKLNSGPCEPGAYADREDALGRKCGPSYAHPRYCWTGSDTVSGEAPANTGNKRGWHKYGHVSGNRYYLQRPDDCYAGTYDSWQWEFSGDNIVYGCSDGKACQQFYCYLDTICPYRR